MTTRAYTEEQKARRRETNRAWQKANKTRVKKVKQDWREANPVLTLFLNTKHNAKAKGRDFELIIEFLEELLQPMICELSGLALSFGAGPYAPSVDRKDCSKGYTPDNVRILAWVVNCALNTHDDVILFKMARAIVTKHGMGD